MRFCPINNSSNSLTFSLYISHFLMHFFILPLNYHLHLNSIIIQSVIFKPGKKIIQKTHKENPKQQNLVYYKMKIKFIPKKQRQELKEIKQKQVTAENQKKIELISAIKDGLHKQNHISNHTNTQAIPQKPQSQQNHKIEQQNEERVPQARQRSRDLKQRNVLTKEQLAQRDLFKKKYLGLVKEQKNKRNMQNYRHTFLFEWNKEDDTFQQGGYLGNTIMKATEKLVKQNIDEITKEQPDAWKNKTIDQMTERDWRIFRQDHQIYVKGGRVPHPIRNWNQVPQLNSILLQNFQNLKFQKPRPIQMQAITIGFQMKDLIAIAPTGEGKTLAYLVPIINFILPLERITGVNSDKGPYAVILAPSRQLAEQIENQFNKISQGLNITSIRLVGGHQLQIQSLNLTKGADIIIGTPGRIKEMIEKRYLSLQRLSWVVIDEADKMISQNLSEEVEYILTNSSSQSALPSELNRQKIIHMFSATMVPEIQKMVKTFLMPNASYITIGEPGGGKKEIEQYVELIDPTSKSERLGKILRNLSAPIIIFVNQRQSCQPLVKRITELWRKTAGEYHGGKTQDMRQKTISQFRSGKIQVLVATDLAGRGLDIKGINAVINYDAPKNISEFIHRAGRTGRAGMKGKCFTFLTAADQNLFYDLRVFLERNEFHIPQNLKSHPSAQVRPGQIAHVSRQKQIVYTN